MSCRIAFDIGGTTLRVGRVAEGALSDVRRGPTPLLPGEALAILSGFIQEVAAGEAVEHIAGGIAGVITEDGVIVTSPHLPAWNGFELGSELGTRFSCRVALHNDADLATLGEARYGAGKGARVVAHLRLGTGVGGSRVALGELEKHAYGFEPGHQVIDFHTGATLESLVGGAALAKKYGAEPAAISAEDYRSQVPALAAGVWNAIVCWSPDVVILGGSLINETNGFHIEDVRAEVEKFRHVLPALPELRLGTLGDDAGLYGAAALLSEN